MSLICLQHVTLCKFIFNDWSVDCSVVTTCMENLEMSWILTAIGEISGILLKVREVSGENSLKLPLLAAYLHIYLFVFKMVNRLC